MRVSALERLRCTSRLDAVRVGHIRTVSLVSHNAQKDWSAMKRRVDRPYLFIESTPDTWSSYVLKQSEHDEEVIRIEALLRSCWLAYAFDCSSLFFAALRIEERGLDFCALRFAYVAAIRTEERLAPALWAECTTVRESDLLPASEISARNYVNPWNSRTHS